MIRALRVLCLTLFLLPLLALCQSVTSESAIVMDSASGKVLWSRNADEQLYPASTTKIMTALLLLEHCKPDEVISAPDDVAKVKESSMHLKPKEKVKAKDMLYALLLRSANDGCYAVAVHIAGSVEKFAEMMNKRAKEIGCTHTNFHNPNGLNDRLHYTTAYDLARIGREAMTHQEFRDIVQTQKTKINRGSNWQDLWMSNHNLILKRDPTCDGIKTGWTIPAGHCFVGSATREDWRVITVVMKSKSWESDTENLFNWAFSTYAKHPEVTAGELCGAIKVNGGVEPTAALVASQNVYSLLRKGGTAQSATHTFDVPASMNAPVLSNEKVGSLLIEDPEGFQQKVELTSGSPVAPSKVSQIGAVVGPILMGWAVVLFVGTLLFRGRSRRRAARMFG